MRVDPNDLVQAFLGKGDMFEAFVHDLVRAVGRSCGIDPVNIDWDHRTNVADGGRDLVVRIANPRPQKQFIPARPSLWSIKSGKEGVNPASLKEEVTKHAKVQDCLRKGWSYVWCTTCPAAHDQREKMRREADEVAGKLNVDAGLIEFRWPEQLQGEVNLYPNLISAHLPGVAAWLTNVWSLREWERELGLCDSWVSFGGRDDVVRQVAEHLLAHQPPNVLHIAGLSGIGKTRTVFEACRRHAELNGVFYVERFVHVSRELYRYLEEDGRNVRLVIDETSLDELEGVASRLREFADRVRVVTIGPALRQPAGARDAILVLAEPDTNTGVLEVVRAAGVGLSPEVHRSIADQSSHDLRLALLLVRASQKLSEFRGTPVINIDGVWRRLMALFGDEVGDPNRFRERYEVLTASIDVGISEDVGGEIAALAKLFEQPVEDVRAVVNVAVNCGLGIRTQRFFEAVPRALANRLFETRVWHRLRDRLDDFFLALLAQSDRLARRFLERCHDCTGTVREEVRTHLGDFFLNALSRDDVTVLASRRPSRLFQTWAEFDPERGLGWLRSAVERATPEQLLSLDGQPDGSGGWRGRRQLVWLAQNLASFGQHFEDCEAILFRLALHETEESIGNNSAAVWSSLFWPILAGTEVPFPRRLPVLMRRLAAATSDQIPLILSAAIECVAPRHLGLPAPPRVVGGRLVPPAWRPETRAELEGLRRHAVNELLDAIAGLEQASLGIALQTVVENLGEFIGLGQIGRVRALLTPNRIDEALRRRLVAKLEEELSFHREHGARGRSDDTLSELELWHAETSPRDLPSRVRDLTTQEYWSTAARREQRDAQYDELAAELIASPDAFYELADWFTGAEARSAGSLGYKVGRQDTNNRLADVIRVWLKADRCRPVTVSYLSGTASRQSGLSGEWPALLDELSSERAELVAVATTSADVSVRGCERLLAVLDRLPPPASRFLHSLAYGEWLQVIRPAQRISLCQALIKLGDSGDTVAARVGLDLVQMWAHVDPRAIDQSLAPLVLDMASRPLFGDGPRDLHMWREVLTLLCPFYPGRVAELMVNRVTEPGVGGRGDDENVAVLARAASSDPSAVMSAVGRAILDRQRRVIFGVAVFRGLFEAIGLDCVTSWLKEHGLDHLRWLARHFSSPSVDDAGRLHIPPLTSWLFRERETDDRAFEAFLMGRQSGVARWEGEVAPERTRREMEPFLQHELRRVREWAEHEIRLEERQAAFLRELDEEEGRR